MLFATSHHHRHGMSASALRVFNIYEKARMQYFMEEEEAI